MDIKIIWIKEIDDDIFICFADHGIEKVMKEVEFNRILNYLPIETRKVYIETRIVLSIRGNSKQQFDNLLIYNTKVFKVGDYVYLNILYSSEDLINNVRIFETNSDFNKWRAVTDSEFRLYISILQTKLNDQIKMLSKYEISGFYYGQDFRVYCCDSEVFKRWECLHPGLNYNQLTKALIIWCLYKYYLVPAHKSLNAYSKSELFEILKTRLTDFKLII